MMTQRVLGPAQFFIILGGLIVPVLFSIWAMMAIAHELGKWDMELRRTGVSRVVDGDTFVAEGGLRVRLWGIDAPEMSDPGGEAAKAMLEALTAGRALRCGEKDIDRYGRTVARCELWNTDHDIACLMVERGHARDWPEYSGGAYAGCEAGGK